VASRERGAHAFGDTERDEDIDPTHAFENIARAVEVGE